MTTIEKCFVPPVPAPSGHRVLAHDGGVLLLPSMRGEPYVPAWWAPDGVNFEVAPTDLDAVGLGPAPVVNALNDHHWTTHVRAGGRAFFRGEGRVLEATIGPRVVFTPCAYQSPAEFKFVLQDLVVDQAGTYWAAGHASRDELIGQIFSSRDGRTWEPVPGKIQGSVLRLIPSQGQLFALHYKHISLVTSAATTKIASMKDHISHAILAPGVTLALGNGFLSVLRGDGKRSKNVAPPTGNGRYYATAVEDGFLLGGAAGLWSSHDGLGWEPVPGWMGAVMAIFPSRSGAVVVTTSSEVYCLR